jgi:YQGE family putative transporter
LNRNFKRFARMHFLYLTATNLSGVFIGAFLLTSGRALGTVGLFFLLCFAVECAGYVCIGGIANRIKPTTLTCLGLALYAGSYLSLLLLRNHTAVLIPVTAFLASSGASLYWLPYHGCVMNYTHDGNRQKGISHIGIAGNCIMLAAPPASGFIVSKLPGMTGYTVIFTVALVTLLCAAAVCLKLPAQATGRSGNVVWGFLRYELKERRTRLIMAGFLLYGFRDGVFSYYISLLIYQMASGGGGTGTGTLLLGFNITARALVSMAVYWGLNAKLTRKQGLTGMVVLAIGWPAAVLALHGWYGPVALFIFSAADIGAQSMIYNGMQVTSYRLGDTLSEEAGSNRNVEAIGVRNAAACFGRVAGCSLFLLIPAATLYPLWALTALTALAAPGALLVRRGYTLLERKDNHAP